MEVGKWSIESILLGIEDKLSKKMILTFLAWTIRWIDLAFYQARKPVEEAGLREEIKGLVLYMTNLKCLLEIQLELSTEKSGTQMEGSKLEKWSWDCQNIDGMQIRKSR